MTLDDALGLPTERALELLEQCGITGVTVERTQAPKREQLEGEERVVAVRRGGKTLVVSRFLTDAPKSR